MDDNRDVHEIADSKAHEETTSNVTRNNILTLMDNFIEQIFQIRRTLLGVSICALILSPIAIGLSIFLLGHPSFFSILEIQNEFGTILGFLLAAMISISAIWLIAGTRQYKKIGSWNRRYKKFVSEKEQMDRKLASKYGY
jgi:uncharacterized membrane protein